LVSENKRPKTTLNKLRVKVAAVATPEKQLALDDWFVKYENVDTRNAIAQGLKLVDHEGDEIFYQGTNIPGFRISFSNVLFLVNSRHNGVYKMIFCHKKPGERVWRRWEENKKGAKETVAGFKRKNMFLKA
jgi:hypothetical protein